MVELSVALYITVHDQNKPPFIVRGNNITIFSTSVIDLHVPTFLLHNIVCENQLSKIYDIRLNGYSHNVGRCYIGQREFLSGRLKL